MSAWTERLAALGATAAECTQIDAERDGAPAHVRAVLDALIPGLPDRAVATILETWRAGAGPFAGGWLSPPTTPTQADRGALTGPAPPDVAIPAPGPLTPAPGPAPDLYAPARALITPAPAPAAAAAPRPHPAITPAPAPGVRPRPPAMITPAPAPTPAAPGALTGPAPPDVPVSAPPAVTASPAPSSRSLAGAAYGTPFGARQSMAISWEGRLRTIGATPAEIAAITLSYSDAQSSVQHALDGLIAGIDNAGLSLILGTWRGGAGPFGDGYPGGGLPFGTEVAILTGNPADDQYSIGAGTGAKVTPSPSGPSAVAVAFFLGGLT